MEKSKILSLPFRASAPALVLALFLHFFPTIPIIKYLINHYSHGVEICQLSEDCTCPAATCQCDHGNDVFFSRFTDIQNGNASLSNNTKVIDLSSISYTTCPSHHHGSDAGLISLSRFVLSLVPQVVYSPKTSKIDIYNQKEPKKISPPEIFHPPEV